MRSIRDIFRSHAVLNADGRHVNGTDKESNHHYGDAYEEVLTIQSPRDDHGNVVRAVYPHSIRNDVRLMMEVGVAGGASLLAWRDVFPNARCVGLDIMPNALHLLHDKERVEFCVGDATSRTDCERAAAGRKFDFICEDATHLAGDSMLTLLYLWPHVRPGGLYVIEEFADILALRQNVLELWPHAEIIDTTGPSGGSEPLVVFRKPT